MIPEPGLYIFAFVVAPAIVVAIGYIGVRILEWHDDRERARESSDS